MQTFARAGGEREPVAVGTEDLAHVLLRLEGGARGSLVVSQVSAGRKNSLRLEVDGAAGALGWDSEAHEQLWLGHRERANEILWRDPSLLAGPVRGTVPGGHPEGFQDAFKTPVPCRLRGGRGRAAGRRRRVPDLPRRPSAGRHRRGDPGVEPRAAMDGGGGVTLILSFYEHPEGIETEAGPRVVYDVEAGTAHLGAAHVVGHALVWELAEYSWPDARVVGEVDLFRGTDWLMRCERVDAPPGSVAPRHEHPGPAILRLLAGSLRIEGPDGLVRELEPGDAWLEGAEHPVVATASATGPTALVRVMLLSRTWAGKRTIRYLDPADEEEPELQSATVLLEEPIELP